MDFLLEWAKKWGILSGIGTAVLVGAGGLFIKRKTETLRQKIKAGDNSINIQVGSGSVDINGDSKKNDV